MKNINERLRKLIKTLCYTQKQFAEVLEVQPSVINRWLRPETPPSKTSCKRIASTIGCSLEWLTTGKGNMFTKIPANTAKLSYAQIGLRLLNGETASSAITEETAPKQQEENSIYIAKEFKELCAANFGLVFDYIAEEYGTENIDIKMFIDDLIEVHHPFRIWIHEKKAERKSNKAGLNKNISTTGVR